jgi:hypothetical protein
MAEGNQFSAVASILGYEYQFRYALVAALKRHQAGPDWSVAIEGADDLVVSGEEDEALLQLKHRAPGTSLSDGSPDLWKTLRVWSEGLRTGSLRLPGTSLFLVTTADASPGSLCEALTSASSDRDNDAIAAALAETACNSESSTLEKAHDAYLKLSDAQRTDLISTALVLPGSSTVEALDEDLRSFVRLMTRSTHIEAFVERLEGWWNRRCLRQLVGRLSAAVRGDDFDAFLSDLREQFHADNLPIDDDVVSSRPEVEPFLQKVFCQQLSLIDLGAARLSIAVRDYHRAFVQRSRWSESGLLELGELARYERTLVEAWELVFERLVEELGEDATAEAKLAVSREIYAWAESADYPIRPACTEGFVSRGSLHILSDERHVGWHPDFELQLELLLESAGSGAP